MHLSLSSISLAREVGDMEHVLYFLEQGVILLHPFCLVENRTTAGIKPAWPLIPHSGTWARGDQGQYL